VNSASSRTRTSSTVRWRIHGGRITPYQRGIKVASLRTREGNATRCGDRRRTRPATCLEWPLNYAAPTLRLVKRKSRRKRIASKSRVSIKTWRRDCEKFASNDITRDIMLFFFYPVQSDASAFGHGRKRDLRDDPGLAAASGEALACRQESSEKPESYSEVRTIRLLKLNLSFRSLSVFIRRLT